MKFIHLILCFLFICPFTFTTPEASSATTDKKFTDDKIQLEYPATWTVMQDNNVVTFKDKEGAETLWVQVISAGFEEAAEEAGFIRVGKDWRLSGRQGIEGDVEEISGSNWRGLLGETMVGIHGSNGYEGLGSATVAMITDGVTSAILSGESMNNENGKKILDSVRFKTRVQGNMPDGT